MTDSKVISIHFPPTNVHNIFNLLMGPFKDYCQLKLYFLFSCVHLVSQLNLRMNEYFTSISCNLNLVLYNFFSLQILFYLSSPTHHFFYIFLPFYIFSILLFFLLFSLTYQVRLVVWHISLSFFCFLIFILDHIFFLTY